MVAGSLKKKIQPWDIAAGILLIQEAGGIVKNLIPNQDVLETGSIITGNPKIFELMNEVIKKYDHRLIELYS